jgi:hypothetical protein
MWALADLINLVKHMQSMQMVGTQIRSTSFCTIIIPSGWTPHEQMNWKLVQGQGIIIFESTFGHACLFE